MAENNGDLNAILAVATRLEFYRDFQKSLDAWLKKNPSMISEYKVAMARIELERIKWEAELDALSDGIFPITPPTAAEVNALDEAVQHLSAKVTASMAVNDFLALASEAADTLRS